MIHSDDVVAKIERADAWVQNESRFVVEVAEGLGCDGRPETGPGLSFRTHGRVVVRVHPKLHHLALGFPDWMRSDIEALTGALRDQRQFAWFNYLPAVGDRDTVELLINTAHEAAQSDTVPRSATAPDGQRGLNVERRAQARADRDDEADLGLILDVLQAYHRHAARTNTSSALKPIRETIFFQWEGPRLPPGGKYSTHLPHSPSARAQRAAGDHRGLVYEHVVPVSSVVRELLRTLPSDTHALRQILDSVSERVIITRAEDASVTSAGSRDRAPDPADPWSRYSALGLTRADFAPCSTG